MKKSVLKRIISLSLAIVMFALFTTNSLAVGNDTAVEDSIAVPIMQAKEGEAIDKYNALLKAWAGGAEVYHDGNIVYPDYYGGAYIDENKNLVITTTSTDKETLAEFAKIIDNRNVIFQEVEYSYNRLIEERNKIVDVMKDQLTRNNSSFITGVGISPELNSVNLYSSLPNNTSSTMITQLKCDSSDFDNIIVITSHSVPQPADTLLLGNGIVNNYSLQNRSRSLGFWARNSNGDLGFVTAPHSTMSANDVIKSPSGVTIGIAGTPHLGGTVDTIFIRRINDNFLPSRQLYDSTITYSTNTWVELPIGATTHSSGISSGYKSGVVRDNNHTTYQIVNGSYVYISNVSISSALITSGDSGGPVLGYSYADLNYRVGGTITARVVPDEQEPGGDPLPGYMIFCKASSIVSTLNITIY